MPRVGACNLLRPAFNYETIHDVDRPPLMLGVVVIAAASLAGCGGDGDDSRYGPQSVWVRDASNCSEVWVDGATLPRNYEGCMDGKDFAVAVLVDCVGDDRFTTYDDRFHAFLGGTITEASPNSQEYLSAYSACTRGG